MSERKFSLKGFREGLLITIDEGDWNDVLPQLISQIDEREGFFKGAKLAIEVDERSMRAAELGDLRDKLSDRGITLFAVLGKNKNTMAVAESLGLSTSNNVLKENKGTINNILYDGEQAILIKKTLRSGMSIKYAGHVLVEGDVNPGAEIIASGSIFIWGRLKGSVHAGFESDTNEIICALDFNPMKLRIAEFEKEELKLRLLKKRRKAVKAFVQDKKIKIEEWFF